MASATAVTPASSDLTVSLHPLVLLTISDYITRHTLRRHTQPIVGALLGQQIGRTISLEQAYEVLLTPASGDPDEPVYRLNEAWFKDRLQQYKDVHTNPPLELVGWFTAAPATGPEEVHKIIHEQIMNDYNDGAVLLAFHPSTVLEQQKSTADTAIEGANMPLSIYETVWEAIEHRQSSRETRVSKRNRKGGEASEANDQEQRDSGVELKFRKLPYNIDTGEAEMIGVDFVAKGAGYATEDTPRAPVDGASAVESSQAARSSDEADRGKSGLGPNSKDSQAFDDSKLLSVEDEELVTALTARANAIKMLHTRIKLLKAYLTSLPPSYLTESTEDDTTTPISIPLDEDAAKAIDYPLLRSIQALLSRLPLVLSSSDLSSFKQESMAEKADVSLISLLGILGQSVKDAKDLGKKFGAIEAGKNSARRLDLGNFSRGIEPGFDIDEGPSLAREALYG